MSRRSEPPSIRAPRTWWNLAKHLWDATDRHRTDGLAAEVAFFAMVALPPLFIALFGAVGYVGRALGPDTTRVARDQIISFGRRFLTSDVLDQTVSPTLDALLTRGHGELLSVGVLFALISTSRSADSLLSSLHIIYDIDERITMWRRRGHAFVYTVVATIWGGVLLPLVAVGPDLLHDIAVRFHQGGTALWLTRVLYWPVVLTSVLLSLTAVYHFALPWRTPFKRDLPGALLAMSVWIFGGFLLRMYARWAVESDPLYGSLASPMVLLLWLYFTALSVLLGAELNSAIEAFWPTTTRGQRKQILKQAVDELRAQGEDIEPVSITGQPPRVDIDTARQELERRARAKQGDAASPPIDDTSG
ncbi:MAG: YihY/virulence factor BrkB family protein [Polyangiaceae bacterium]